MRLNSSINAFKDTYIYSLCTTYNELFVLMSILAKFFLPFVSSYLSEFAFSSAGHLILSLRFRAEFSMNKC